MAPDLETHRQLAAVAWRKRRTLLSRPLTRDTPLLKFDWDLAAHMHLLSVNPGGKPGKRPGQTFTWLASHLAAGDKSYADQALGMLADVLRDKIELPEEVRDALVLYPSKAGDAWLSSLFEERPELRAGIISIWRDRGAELPASVQAVSEADLGRDTPLGAALVSYHAHVMHGRPELLEACYRPLLRSARIESLPSYLPDALWGAAVRGDTRALEALDRALAGATGEHAADLLRVAAWTGDERFVGRLKTASGRYEGREWYWMALHGDSRLGDVLLEAMGAPRWQAQVQEAWLLLTGHDPVRRPRLQVISGHEGAGGQPAEAGGEVVDVDVLRHWWQAQQWAPGRRYLAGEPASPRLAVNLASTFCGRLGQDLVRVAEFAYGTLLGASVAGWRRDVRVALSRMSFRATSSRPMMEGAGA